MSQCFVSMATTTNQSWCFRIFSLVPYTRVGQKIK